MFCNVKAAELRFDFHLPMGAQAGVGTYAAEDKRFVRRRHEKEETLG